MVNLKLYFRNQNFLYHNMIITISRCFSVHDCLQTIMGLQFVGYLFFANRQADTQSSDRCVYPTGNSFKRFFLQLFMNSSTQASGIAQIIIL